MQYLNRKQPRAVGGLRCINLGEPIHQWARTLMVLKAYPNAELYTAAVIHITGCNV